MNQEASNHWVATLEKSLPEGSVSGQECFRDQTALIISLDKLPDVMQILRDTFSFRYLIDLTALDFHPAEPRFQVVYHLWSHQDGRLMRIKASVEGNPPTVPTVTHLWSSANWHERECYDLFGIVFNGHPDLRRILLPEDWEGHPLRKDYPLEGY